MFGWCRGWIGSQSVGSVSRSVTVSAAAADDDVTTVLFLLSSDSFIHLFLCSFLLCLFGICYLTRRTTEGLMMCILVGPFVDSFVRWFGKVVVVFYHFNILIIICCLVRTVNTNSIPGDIVSSYYQFTYHYVKQPKY